MRLRRNEVEPLVELSPKGMIIQLFSYAEVAQVVERGTENPCVRGSTPFLGIFFFFASVTRWAIYMKLHMLCLTAK